MSNLSENIKKELIARHVASIMDLLNIELDEDTKNTPNRVAKMYVDELFSHANNKGLGELYKSMTTFKAPNNNPIIIRNIPFHSVCSHHLLPFSGYATVEYVPGETIIGLSKVPRVVKFFSKKPQVQENLTGEIGSFLWDILRPLSLKVTLHDVKHTCVSCRGIESDCEVDTVFEKHR